MRGFERWNDAFEPAKEMESLERFVVGCRDVLDPALLLQPRMLRADAGIVETGRNRMRLGDLPLFVLQEVGPVAVQHAGTAAGQRGGMFASLEAFASRFDADDAHTGIVEERMEQAHGIGAA